MFQKFLWTQGIIENYHFYVLQFLMVYVGHLSILKRTFYRNDPRDQLFRNQNKCFALRILTRSRHNFVLIYFFVNKYVYCLHNMPDKRRLVTSKVCFGSEKAGLLDHSYNKCALESPHKFFTCCCSCYCLSVVGTPNWLTNI